jgi:molybdopterin synthase catalytic subunit
VAELVAPPRDERDWLAVTGDDLPVLEALAWAGDAACGALVVFCGVVRDHAEGRPGVVALEYEAYEEQVEPRLRSIADEAHARWPSLARLVAIHRVGALRVGDVAVIVVAATEHRDAAFGAARFTIDTVKASLPIWKLETWEGGRAWSEACEPLDGPPPVGTADGDTPESSPVNGAPAPDGGARFADRSARAG